MLDWELIPWHAGTKPTAPISLGGALPYGDAGQGTLALAARSEDHLVMET